MNARPSLNSRLRTCRKFHPWLFTATAVATVLTGPIQAANINWDNTSGDFLWATPENWVGDLLPSPADIAVLAQNTAQTISLGGTTQSIQGLLFNQASAYVLTNGAFVLGQLNQTGNVNNQIAPTVTISTPTAGVDILTSNITSNTLQVQGQVTAGGLTKTGGGLLRLGTSGTDFQNAINGPINLNGGTLMASAAGTNGANNPLGGTGTGSDLINIGASGVTLQLTAQSHYDFGRQVVAGNRSFTLRGDPSTGDPGDFVMTIGKISIGDATLTATTGSGYQVRTTELALDTGATTTVFTNNFLHLGTLSGDATSKIIKDGASDLRITGNTTNATTFAGDIDHHRGWLVLESSSATAQPLGNPGTQITITNSVNNPVVSLRAEASRTFDGVNINAGNNNFELDVRNLTGTATGFVMTAGTVSIGNATMNVRGERAQARLAGLSLESGATSTINVNNFGTGAAQNLRVDTLTGDATVTLRKTGGQFMVIGATDGTFDGRLEVGGGTTAVEASAGLNPIRDLNGPITFINGATLSLRANDTLDFGDNVDFAFAPDVVSSTLDLRRSSGALTGRVLSFGDLNLSGGGMRTLTVNQGESYTGAADAIVIGANTVGQIATNTNLSATSLSVGTGAIFNKLGGSILTLSGDNSATILGAVNLRAGTITATVAGSLGNQGIVVGNAVASSAGFTNDLSRLNYNVVDASGATGFDAVAIAGGVTDLNVTPGVNESFSVQAHGRIQGSTAQMAALTVGTNLALGADAILSHDNPSSAGNTVNNLAGVAEKSIFYGIANTANSLPIIGAGTPWKGIAGDNATRTIQGSSLATPAAIAINGGDNNPATVEAYLQSVASNLALGATAAGDNFYVFSSTAAGGEKVTLGIRGYIGTTSVGLGTGGQVSFNDTAVETGIATAVDKIIVEGGMLQLGIPGTLGGVPVEVVNTGVLDIQNNVGNFIDGNVLIKDGGALVLNDTQPLGGSGTITIGTGGKLDVAGNGLADILSGGTQAITFSGTNHTVRFSTDNIAGLDGAVPDQGATFVVAGGAATSLPTADAFGGTGINDLSINTQTAGLSTNGGVITNGAGSQGLSAPLTIGANGATFAATRGTNFVIGNAVSTTGDIQVGSATAIDGRDKSNNPGAVNGLGQPDPYNSGSFVWFAGAFAANDVTITNQHVGFINADTTITGTLTANGGVLYLDGGGSSGATQGQLTPKLLDGTLATGGIVLGEYTRTELRLNLPSDGSRTNVTQAFVIDGEVNPQDNRRFWVSRNAGSATGVNFTDITLNAGAALAFDEDNTDVRAAVKLAGNAATFTGAHDVMDFTNITRAPSLPAYDGTNPVTLTHGRVNVAGIQGFNTGQSNVFGEIAAGVEVNLVRGQFHFAAGSEINGVVRAHTAPAGGDAFVISSSNNGSNTFNTPTTIGGIGRIELGRSGAANGPEDFEVRGTEVTNATAGQAPLHTHAGEIRIINDGVNSNLDGIIRANRVNDSDRTARVQVDNVHLNAGAGLQLTSLNGVPLTVGSITLAGDGTIDTAGAGMTITNLDATAANVLNLTGAFAPTIASPVSTGTINVSNANFGAVVNTTGSVNVQGGIVTFADQVGSGVTVTSGSAVFNPGAGNTRAVGGNVALDDGGQIVVNNGTLDLGNHLITSTSSETFYVAGLREGSLGGSFNTTGVNTSPVVKLGPVMAQTTAGWPINTTFVYTGEILIPDNGVPGDGLGSVAFGESFDDGVHIAIDGVQRLNNNTWNDSTGTGELVLEPGWHQVEFRFGQGTGGAGPVAQDGWNGQLGFGIDLTPGFDAAVPTTNPVQAEYVAPLDNGAMNLFRAATRNGLSVAANTTVQAGGFKNLSAVQFTGASSQVTLTGAGPSVASSSASLEVSNGASGNLTIVRAGDSVAVESLVLNGSLAFNGEGDFAVTGDGTGAGGLTKSGSGDLIVNGTIAGLTTVLGGTLSGNGIFGGLAVDGAIIAPGASPGIITAGSLTATAGSMFVFELGSSAAAGSPTPGLHYDQITVTGNMVNLGDAALELAVISHLQQDDVLTVILNNGPAAIVGGFAGYTNGALIGLPNGYQVQLSYFDDASTAGFELAGGNDVSFLVTVPEPGSALLLLTGLGSVIATRRRRGAN